MRIACAELTTAGSRIYRQDQGREESLRAWVGKEPGLADPSVNDGAVKVQLSDQSEKPAQIGHQPVEVANTEEQDLLVEDPSTRTIRLVLEMLTGKKIRVGAFTPHTSSADTPHIKEEGTGAGSPMAGWGLEYDSREYYSEYEETSFTAQGHVLTQDNKEIRFDLSLVMTRGFTESSEIHIRAGDAKFKDPLIINFTGNAASLTDARFHFDLDADGATDKIPFLRPGSGFLVFDKNEDGVINDGTELFGPLTGNGFKELAEYDTDENGWIDENDPIFAKLAVWSKDAAGTDYFHSLYNKGIGALFLDQTSTNFSLRTPLNDVLGQIKDTSVFLQENGVVGTIQEIDLAV